MPFTSYSSTKYFVIHRPDLLTIEYFKKVLGKTGAAKSLHLLAPRFFPLWDTKIAKTYGVKNGMEADRYLHLADDTKRLKYDKFLKL
jgi:hypothetical protein